jgi:nucleobase:cation symporter-1, NCS1 family
VGVVPCLPGFVAAVNTSVKVTDSATEFYYLNYLYGFLVSASIYSLLHFVFPDQKLNAFVRDSPSAKELQQTYDERWAIVTGENSSVSESVSGEGSSKGLQAKTQSV